MYRFFWTRTGQVRDQSLTRLKSQIELMYVTNGYKKVVVVPHSMGAIYFLHFLKWVETPLPNGGGGGGSGWCSKHLKAVVNIGPAFLGVPKAISNLLSAEGKDIAYARLGPSMFQSYFHFLCLIFEWSLFMVLELWLPGSWIRNFLRCKHSSSLCGCHIAGIQ